MPIDWDEIPQNPGRPDFNNLLAVLQRSHPKRPTLFEFFMNDRIYRRLAPEFNNMTDDPITESLRTITAFYRLGYDYAIQDIPGFSFSLAAKISRKRKETVSQNEASVIHTREDFDNFPWPDPDLANYGVLDHLKEYLQKGMKFVVCGPGGLLENAVSLVGYQNLCLMTMDDRSLAEDIFAQIGSRLVRYYEIVAQYDCVGACLSNDDWGFKTHTIFSTADMRHFVFPWHKRMVEVIHAAGKPAILHSCGHIQRIIEDVIDDMQYDGRHSYEDSIMPVEEAYDKYHDRIAILGGIDIDFICRSSPEEIYKRSTSMIKRTEDTGSYALGTGNSVPDFLPDHKYFALIRAVLDQR